MKENKFKERLKHKMDGFVHFVYKITRKFPKEELYDVTSQLRRAAMSVILNYVEGFARRKRLIQLNFLEISYGSLKECKYLLHFSLVEKFLDNENYQMVIKLAEEIGAMLWTEINSLEKTSKNSLLF
jgi:four helix bundle protein